MQQPDKRTNRYIPRVIAPKALPYKERYGKSKQAEISLDWKAHIPEWDYIVERKEG